MYKIVMKKELVTGIKMFEIEALRISKKIQPGQFIVLKIDEKGERIPLTVFESYPTKGTLSIIFQEVGKTTLHLGRLGEGDCIQNIMGPLGKPSGIEKHGNVVIVGGGVGTALAYPVAKALKKAGNNLTTVMGARTENLLILVDEMKSLSEDFYITTDDGSRGHHGFVTDILKKLIRERREIDLVFAVGPTIMMKAVAEVTRNDKIKTMVSLNPIMLDATGMCGVCRVNVGGETKFACVDGPEFDAHEVDFDELMARLRTYIAEEKKSIQKFMEKI